MIDVKNVLKEVQKLLDKKDKLQLSTTHTLLDLLSLAKAAKQYSNLVSELLNGRL